MVSAEKSGQHSVSATESLLICTSNLRMHRGSADTYQPIQKWNWNSVLAVSLLLNRKQIQFKFSHTFCTYKSGSKLNPRYWGFTHIPKNIWILQNEWHSHMQCRYHHFYCIFTCKLMFASETSAATILSVLTESSALCSAQSFNYSFVPSTQDLSGTKDASFLECKKRNGDTPVYCCALWYGDMSSAREFYLHL